MAVPPGSYTPYIPPRDITVDSRRLVERLSNEMGSGRHADVGRSVASDFSALSRLSHETETYPARIAGLQQARTWTAATQAGLSSMEGALSGIADKLSATFTPTGLADPSVIGETGQAALTDIIRNLNTMIDGRAVFGNGSSAEPMAAADLLLADIEVIAAAAPDLATYQNDLDLYFGAAGGFEASILLTTKATPASFPDGEGGQIEINLSGGDPEIRAALRQAAFFAGLPSAGFSAQEIVWSQRSADIVADVQGAISGLIDMQGRTGVIEERIETKLKTLSQQQLATEMEIGRLTKVDEYETASHLQNEFTRLESLYAITARRSRLNLTSFLR